MQKGNEKTVEFRSTPENYEKEKSGAKPNTVRTADSMDGRFVLLCTGKATHILIRNKETEETFTREITDVTSWQGDVIISWKHPEQPPQNKEFERGKSDGRKEMLEEVESILKGDETKQLMGMTELIVTYRKLCNWLLEQKTKKE